MKSLQDHFLDTLESLSREHNLTAVQSADYANVGTVRMVDDGFHTQLTVSYGFLQADWTDMTVFRGDIPEDYRGLRDAKGDRYHKELVWANEHDRLATGNPKRMTPAQTAARCLEIVRRTLRQRDEEAATP